MKVFRVIILKLLFCFLIMGKMRWLFLIELLTGLEFRPISLYTFTEISSCRYYDGPTLGTSNRFNRQGGYWLSATPLACPRPLADHWEAKEWKTYPLRVWKPHEMVGFSVMPRMKHFRAIRPCLIAIITCCYCNKEEGIIKKWKE